VPRVPSLRHALEVNVLQKSMPVLLAPPFGSSRSPLTSVPLELPTSVSVQPSAVQAMTPWRSDTAGSPLMCSLLACQLSQTGPMRQHEHDSDEHNFCGANGI
jgi:hypothetical protein